PQQFRDTRGHGCLTNGPSAPPGLLDDPKLALVVSSAPRLGFDGAGGLKRSQPPERRRAFLAPRLARERIQFLNDDVVALYLAGVKRGKWKCKSNLAGVADTSSQLFHDLRLAPQPEGKVAVRNHLHDHAWCPPALCEEEAHRLDVCLTRRRVHGEAGPIRSPADSPCEGLENELARPS